MFVCRYYAGVVAGGCIAVFYACLYANIVGWSVPETYVVSSLFLTLSVLALRRFEELPTTAMAVALGSFIGLTGLLHPSLLLLNVPAFWVCFARMPWRRAATLYAAVSCISVTLFTAAHLLLRAELPIHFYADYLNRWSSSTNLMDVEMIIFVPVSFFLMGIVAPVDGVQPLLTLHDSSQYVNSLLRLAGLAGYIVALAFAGISGWRHADLTVRSLVSFLLSLTLFHIYFNPHEAMLYASQVQLPIVLIFATGWRFMSTTNRIAASILAVFICILNLASITAR